MVTAPAWRTSGYSYGGGNCVQVASQPPAIAVRDSKNPGGPQLRFTPDAWQAFTRGLK